MNHQQKAPADYVDGFRSSDFECESRPLEIKGEVPSWLTGKLIRTTPARFGVGDGSYRHWFDGLAQLHAFDVCQGRVGHSARFLRSRTYCENESHGKIRIAEFATDPCYSLFGRVSSWFTAQPTDNANVNVERVAGETFALTETRLPVRFDPETLHALDVGNDDAGPLGTQGDPPPGPISSAHPHFDRTRACYYSYTIDFGRRSRYCVFSIDQSSGARKRLIDLPVRHPAYMHSFGMSERYLVFAEFPFRVRPLALLFRTRPFIENYRWNPEQGVRLRVVDKDTARCTTYHLNQPLFAFHHVNAFERDGNLLVDLIGYENPNVIEQLYLERLRSSQAVIPAGKLMRLTVPLPEAETQGSDRAGDKTEQVGIQNLSDRLVELPRINDSRCRGTANRFVFAAAHLPGEGDRHGEVDADFLNALSKIDLEGSCSAVWRQPHCYPGEPVFVDSPQSVSEDDGVILSVVLDSRAGRSFLLVLDAKTWTEQARADIGVVIPFGFHGNFFPH